MAIITFAHVTYRIDRVVTINNPDRGDHGRLCIWATDTSGEFPAGQEWRATVSFTRWDYGYRFSSNNVSTALNNPAQTAMIDAAVDAFKAEEAAKAATPAPQAPETVHPHRETTINRAIAGNVYITDAMVEASETLRAVALNFTKMYAGHNTFVQDVAVRLADRGTLSIPQMRGVLNQMIREAKIERSKPAPDAFRINFADVKTPAGIRTFNEDGTPAYDTPLPVAGSNAPLVATITPVVPNGTYTVPINDAGEYRVIKLVDCPEHFNKPAGTQIAKFQSGADNEADFTGFAFVTGTSHGVWSKFRNARDVTFALTKLLTLGRHAEFGKLWAMESKRCFICGKKLTVPVSKLAGIGPICAENTGIDIDALAALNSAEETRKERAKAQADIDELFPE